MAVEERLDLNLTAGESRRWTGELIDGITRALYARQGMDNKIAGYWERYECRPPAVKLPFREASNIRVPLTTWIVDALWVRTMRTAWGQIPYLRVVDQDLASAPEALPIQMVLQHLAETDLKLRFRAGHLFLNAFVEGTAIGKLRQEVQTRRIRDRRPWYQRLLMGDDLVELDVVDRVGLAYDVLDLKDFVVAHPAIVDVDRQPWVAHRVWLAWDDIERRVDEGVYKLTRAQLDELKPLGKARRLTASYTALEQVKAEIDKAEDIGWPTQEEWEVWEVEGRYHLGVDKTATECMWAVFADYPQAPALAQKIPFWNGHRNYIIYRPKPRANRFYGIPIAGEVQPLQDEADVRVNQDLNAKTLQVLAGLTPILPRHLKKEWEKHKWEMLKPIWVDAPETFRTMAEVMGNLREMDPQLDRIFGMAERSQGVSDPQLGKPSEGRKTAHEIATVQSEGNIKFAEYIEQIQTSNTELGFQVLEHAYQLALESPAFANRIARVAGTDPFEGVSLQQVRSRWSVIPVGNTQVANRELEARKWMAIYELLVQDPFVNADPRHAYYLRRQLLQAAGLTREVEELLGTQREVELFAQLTLQMRAMQGDPSAQVLLASGGQTVPPVVATPMPALGPNGEMPSNSQGGPMIPPMQPTPGMNQ